MIMLTRNYCFLYIKCTQLSIFKGDVSFCWIIYGSMEIYLFCPNYLMTLILLLFYSTLLFKCPLGSLNERSTIFMEKNIKFIYLIRREIRFEGINFSFTYNKSFNTNFNSLKTFYFLFICPKTT